MPSNDLRWRSGVRVEAMVVERLHCQGERSSASMRADATGSGYRRRHRRGTGIVDVLQTRHLATAAPRLPARSPFLVHAILVHTAQVRFSSRMLLHVSKRSRARCGYDIYMHVRILIHGVRSRGRISDIPDKLK